MAALDSVDDVADWLDDRARRREPGPLRMMVKQFAEALMAAEADAACGAGYRERTAERVNSRNGYRLREWDTRAGSIELAVPNCGRAATSRNGCWNVVAELSRR